MQTTIRSLVTKPYRFSCVYSAAVKIQHRAFHLSHTSFDVNSDFDAAKTKLNSLKTDPGNEAKLKLYALYKQATTGPNNTAKPGMLDFVAKVKWDAWNGLGKLSHDDAKRQYIDVVESLSPSPSSNEKDSGNESTKVAEGDFEEILYEKHGNLTVITINRPQKRNAFSVKSYAELVQAFERAASDSNCRILALTGAGDFYSSGNDLGNFAAGMKGGGSFESMAQASRKILDEFISAFLNFPKPLVALVNGPAVGIAVTTLALCDVVYASDSATFQTPFAVLGQTPEGVSSYTYPLVMGFSNANDMLLLGRKISAQQAQQRGLVTDVWPTNTFVRETTAMLKEMADSFAGVPESLLDCKRVLRRPHHELMVKVQDFESETLAKRWLHPECMGAITKFMSRKK